MFALSVAALKDTSSTNDQPVVFDSTIKETLTSTITAWLEGQSPSFHKNIAGFNNITDFPSNSYKHKL